ncbi:putative holin-like toxin [Camelliibacillus cellulosilyticus]|uniref:Holin-like toxin n=1 Tax=Camelliibacillus cellulosilyticus TaxID=2174486 RepID=A0ABV9GM91_9BACL
MDIADTLTIMIAFGALIALAIEIKNNPSYA